MAKLNDFPARVYIIDVVLNYIEYMSKGISASEIDDEVEDLNIQWDEFVDSIIGKLELRRFEIVDDHESNRIDSNSYYITFYPRTPKGEIRKDILVQLRISDHRIKRTRRKEDASDRYHEALRKRYGLDDDIPEFKAQDIVIGTRSFPTRNSALHYVDYLCDELSRKYVSALDIILEEFIGNEDCITK